MADKQTQMNVRMPEELVNRLKTIAERENRSLAAQIRTMLDRAAKEIENNG